MGTLEEGARNAAVTCMAIKPNEHVLIITDKEQFDVGDALRRAAQSITSEVRLHVLEDYGVRPMKSLPEAVERDIQWTNVSFWAASSKEGELSVRGPFLREIVKHARHGHMPSVKRKVMEQGMCTDYAEISKLSHKLYDFVTKAKMIEISGPNGTRLRAEFNPGWRWKVSDGIYHEKGEWGNLPDGEVFTAPFKVDGHLVADELGDWFSDKYGVLTPPENSADTPVSFSVKDSRIDLKTLRCKNGVLKAELLKYLKTDENSVRAAEFAFPTNTALMRMPLIGNLLQDEKARMHIAFGNPYPEETGADWSSKTHVDFLIKRCSVSVDGKEILRGESYLF